MFLAKPSALDVIAHPYVLWTCRFGDETAWCSRIDGRTTPTALRSDPLGFLSYFDYETPASPTFVETYGKLPGDRIVLLTGGSTVHGVGASGNRRTIAGQMERFLNDLQTKWHYRVINLGMTGWSAYQQAIGLELWGKPFDPDWVVVLNGAHDAMAALQPGPSSATPPGISPLVWPDGSNRSVDGARLWGPLPPPLPLRRRGLSFLSSRRSGRATAGETAAALGRCLAAYIEAQKAILSRFRRARYIVSVQPWANLPGWSSREADPFPTYWTTFAAEDRAVHHEALLRLHQDLDAWSARVRAGAPSVDETTAREAVQWFLIRAAFDNILSLQVAPEDGPAAISHVNVNAVLPEDPASRQPLFLDPIHLTDQGQEMVGRFFAQHILAADGLA
ncbi:SGNH/GDSL hydrolase family protein [Azospirillum sp. INR13]|uniref:SGNH/GDSL hydrolase family protein n=1 Tax=Azospirillum sp. INR13 TaxID=2596919 RepID=UPI0018927D4D|nr:SGNH/GDSL hydrolase family protein [Azospirillum sp. INR13]MBF5093503.1 SGNH/GDSL hydrolase family protein [Azospirillum sp. INR13]